MDCYQEYNYEENGNALTFNEDDFDVDDVLLKDDNDKGSKRKRKSHSKSKDHKASIAGQGGQFIFP